MFYIYIIYSSHGDTYYLGHSQNPWQRLEQHNNNEPDKFTGRYSDWVLRAVFAISEHKGDADKIEKWLKRQKSRKLLERLIDPLFEPSGELAQLLRVPHVRD